MVVQVAVLVDNPVCWKNMREKHQIMSLQNQVLDNIIGTLRLTAIFFTKKQCIYICPCNSIT